MRQLESSASLDSMTSSTTSSSGPKEEADEGETHQGREEAVSPRSEPISRSSVSVEHQELAQPSAKASSRSRPSPRETSHHFDSVPPLSDKPASPSKDTPGALSPVRTVPDHGHGHEEAQNSSPETTAQTPSQKEGGSSEQGQQQMHEAYQQNPQDDTSPYKPNNTLPRPQTLQQQQHLSLDSAPHPSLPNPNHPSAHPRPYPPQPQQQLHHSPYAQPLHRSAPPSPYYPARPHHGPSKPFSGQQGQGPGMGAIALPHHGPPEYAMPPPPPPFFGSNPSSVPPSPGSRRPIIYPGQPVMSPGSHSGPLADARPGPPFHAAGGYKHPYMHPGYPQEYQQPGYYQTSDGWRPVPAPALQKKPKDLDIAMWVGNVLSDTTVAELKAIFEAEPTEAEGNIPHDVPEAKVQSRLERMRLEGSPLLDSSSSGGEGSSPAGSGHGKRKPKPGQKKSRSSSSLGYAESRYFIMKSLNEEDLKLSAQFGLWATQEHLVPILNEAFMNSKNVYLVFSANKSGEFFGYARMMDFISTENEATMMAGREDQIWQPALEIPLSPEMKAAMLEEIEQAAKEGRQLTFDEAEAISRASTTTKSWGIMFPVKWIDVHKVPFAKTTHMLNPLYENREVKVSKDGTEVEPTIGEQLVSLFKKSTSGRKGRGSVSGTTSRTNSEAGDSRRSSVAGDTNSLAPLSTQRTTSSRRSSVMSTRSTGSGGGDRRPSLEPSRSQGSNSKASHSPHPSSHRSQFGTEGYQSPHSSSSGYRSSTRTQYYNSSNTPQGLYSDHPGTQEHPRSGWNSKTNYRGGHGGYISSPYGAGPHVQQGGYYSQDQSPGYRKGGPGGGKYNASYHPGPHSASGTGAGGSYEGPSSFGSPHNNRRQGGSQPSTSPGHYRANVSPPGADNLKHSAGGSPPALGGPGQAGSHDHGGYSGGARGGPMAGGQGPSYPAGGMMPPHPGMYTGQGPHGAHYASFPPPGYPMMPPYMGYSYVPGPNPFMHGTMAWHPGQGPPMPGGLIPGPSMVSGHAASMPMIPGAHGEIHGMEGMVPLIGYDGLAYGYIPAEEAYHQHMYGYGYMPHGSGALGHHGETQEESEGNEVETGEGVHDNDEGDEGETTAGGLEDDEKQQTSRSRSLTDSTRTLTQGEDEGEDEGEEETSRVRTRTSRSISSSTTVSSSSTLIPPSGNSRKKSSTATTVTISKDGKEGESHGVDGDAEVIEGTDTVHE
ncbi:hypothetical protein EC991_011231 [Linnemannia zychae]|nr:hypothetical protein EC991_011231 [Linnemannia zychae]